MSTQVILLERVDNLGNMGDVVSVRPGYARNYLLPQRKALRASKENVAYFEAQKKHLQAENEKRRGVAEKLAKKIEGLKVSIIRQASEAGQLFGSVSARDIAADASVASGEAIARSMVHVNQSYKSIGLFPVEVALHPEVKVTITVNIARSQEEAEIQLKTGRAMIAETKSEATARAAQERAAAAADQVQLESVLEEGALVAEKEKQAAREAKEEKKSSKAKAKAAASEDVEAAPAAEGAQEA